ncbi:hypothetical protein ACJZ2D_016955 [Fusarium nematophilum]
MAGVQTTPEVQVDDDVQSDSAFGDDSSAASNSITSSVMKYEWKHGRRYHSDRAGQYSFPNDDTEQDRLDMIHHVFYRLLEDRLFLAPIEPNGLNILDIGTGTGIWAIQLGDEHPSATVVGNDLSPIQPDWVPPNVKFVVDDVEMDWESANTLYSEDGSLAPENPMVRMMDNLMLACDKIGRTMDPAPSFRRWAEATGFTELKEERFKLPIGPWPKDQRLKEIGTLMGANFYEGVAAFTAVLFTEVLGWSREEVELFNASVREASRQRAVHPIFDFVVVTGRKPE